MKKKIKITESQLKTIIENRQEVNEGVSIGMLEMQISKKYAGMIINELREEFGDDFHEKINLEWVGNGIKHDLQYYHDQQPEFERYRNPEFSEEPKDMPGFEGTMDSLNNLSIRKDDMMNESIVKIKNNFKRFL